MAFWSKEFSHEEVNFILGKIKEIREVKSSGEVTLRDGDCEGWVSILISSISLKFESNAIRRRAVRQAIFNPSLPEDFNENQFCRAVCKASGTMQGKNLKKYRVAFPIWNRPRFLRSTRKIGRITLNFSPSTLAPQLQTNRARKRRAKERE
ncbi:hypothetical protein JMK10_20490 [Rhodovulum sulfidophilum]|uniref:hypothetical protein n=1 Tax=Rhodovulum sulfidophilum TaxID=35806 RepID=UPI0019215DDE|nr:hypothetical protein [Rhodovulum sulfidophilum]MBL3576337.1 hypothetical protein [Rhodovulum sulfidophilum]MCE8433901.1 hypothetical protein [Rhodovulum sulfidophilum]MCF4119069.1 hypothetical protein [Rhodovulum sulfidophilum]